MSPPAFEHHGMKHDDRGWPHGRDVAAAAPHGGRVSEAGRAAAKDADVPWPSPEDREHGRELYQDYLKDFLPEEREWEGIREGILPDGEELLSMERDDASRADKARHWLDDEFEHMHDGLEEVAPAAGDLFRHPPPGHPVVAVPAGPEIALQVPVHAGVDPTGMADLVLVGGIVGTRAGRWLWNKVVRREGDHDAGN
jgi:hypothetical protein